MSFLNSGPQRPNAPPTLPMPRVPTAPAGGGSTATPSSSTVPDWLKAIIAAGGSTAATWALGQIPGLGGHTVNSPQMPSDIAGLRGDVIGWLRGQGQTPNVGGQSPFGSVNQQGGFGGMGPSPIFSGGSGVVQQPSVTNTNNRVSPTGMTVPVNRMSMDLQGDGPPIGAQTNYGGPAETAPTTTAQPSGPGGGYGQIFSGYSGPFTPATTNAAQVGNVPTFTNTTLGPGGNANYHAAGAADAVGAGQYLDPRFGQIFDLIPGLARQFMGGTSQAVAAPVRSVANIASVKDMVQNIADIVNGPAANGYFKDQVLQPYQALFAQERGNALAQAREASGNLTGSGYANALGGAINQLVPQENVQLSNVLTALATQEQNKQQQVAEREQGTNVQNQNTDLARALEDARLQTQASITNAGESGAMARAGLSSTAGLYNTFAQIFGQNAQNQAHDQNQVAMFNIDQQNQTATQQSIANANNATQQAIAQGQITSQEAQNYFNAILRRDIENANLNQNTNQFNAGQYNTAGMFNSQQQQNNNNFNASQFLALLNPLLNGGVGPGTQGYQPGAVDSFAQMLPYFMQFFGNRAGSGTTTIPTQQTANGFNYTPSTFSWNPFSHG